MRRLLKFYEDRLPESQKKALGLLALFRIPVSEAQLTPLWKRNDSLHDALHELHLEGLLTADPGEDRNPRYVCHPILRDYFRAQVTAEPGFAREAANLIAGPPDAQKTRSLEAIQIIASAIEVLLDAGEVIAADNLYKSRLENGNLFRWLPASHWGMQVARAFVRNQACNRGLTTRSEMAWYLNEVGLFAEDAGEPETALEFYAKVIAIYRKEKNEGNICIGLQNLGRTEVLLGYLAQATIHFAEAFELGSADEPKRHVLSYIGEATSLRGDVDRADTHFAEANAIENRIDAHKLYSLRGIQWAEHLIRIRSEKRARQLTEANRIICDRNGWQQDVARCEWILGWLDTLVCDWSNAHAHLNLAKATFTAGHMIYELARVFVTESACYLGQSQWEHALIACEQALQLAAPRNYRLIHVDALNLRARIKRERPNPDPTGAADDAEFALQLAKECDYRL